MDRTHNYGSVGLQPLADNDVHLWVAPLNAAGDERALLWHVLSDDERQRALRFKFAIDRDRYVIARGILRRILGLYLLRSPSSLVFARGKHGKPELASPYDRAGIEFNLSHSEAVAAYAIASRCRVGVDIERVRSIPGRERIAQHFFSRQEQSELADVPDFQKDYAFLACWTRKEAYLKALGCGLSAPLHSFATSAAGGPRLTRVDWDPDDVNRWRLEHFTPTDGYIGALAVEASEWRLMVRHLDEIAERS